MANKKLAAFLGAILFFAGCFDNPTEVVGGASGTEVGCVVKGSVATDSGNTVQNAHIYLRPAGYLAKGGPQSPADSMGTIADTTTGINGRYSFNAVSPGQYFIEAISPDSQAVLLKTSIGESEREKPVPVGTVEPMALLSGSVERTDIDTANVQSAQVHIYGLQRQIRVDSLGQFQVKVPKGRHKLRMAYGKPDDSPVELQLDVVPGEYKHIGRLRLHHKPPPHCHDFQCDSLVLWKWLKDEDIDTKPIYSASQGKRRRITKLSLRGYGLLAITPEIVRLSNLRVLDLGNNRLTQDINVRLFLPRLKVLKLDSNMYRQVPDFIEHAHKLEVLDIHENKLTGIPDFLLNFSHISYLDISHNELCAVPEETAAWADLHQPGWQESQNCREK